MSELASFLLGRVVVRAIQEDLRHAEARPLLRVRGFVSADEVDAISTALRSNPPTAKGGPICTVVISKRRWAGPSEEFFLPPDRTATTYRHDHSLPGCLFIEKDEPSDSQGLNRIRQLSDNSVLPARHQLDGAARLELTSGVVWDSAVDGDRPLPTSLRDALYVVFEAVARGRGTPALREWLRFADSVCRSLSSGGAIDEAMIWQTIGEKLGHLRLLLDASLRDSHSPDVRRRSLLKNVRFSGLRDARGKALDEPELLEKCAAAEFVAADGSSLPAKEQQEIRATVERIVQDAQPSPSCNTDIQHWDRLFEVRKKKSGLGDEIRVGLESDAADLVTEFDDLQVQDGLNERDPDDALTLLEAPGIGDSSRLVDSLPIRLRRAVEQCALPRVRRSADPLRHLLRSIYELVEGRDLAGEAELPRLWLEPGIVKAGSTERSTRLFAWAYGPTLGNVAEMTKTSTGIAVAVDPVLMTPTLPWTPDDLKPDDDDSEIEQDGWAPLQLHLRWDDEKHAARRFEWDHSAVAPFAALARISTAAEMATYESSDLTLDRWLEFALAKPEGDFGMLGGIPSEADPGGPSAKWLELRRGFLELVSRAGIESSSLLDYVDRWMALLNELRIDFVPQGQRPRELQAFLGIDMLRDASGRHSVLASHPLRLRWLGHHLRRMQQQLIDVANVEMKLNEANPDWYFERLDRLSAHDQPPLVCCDGVTLEVATREVHGHEQFDSVETESSAASSWLSDLDDAAVDELAGAAREYLLAYPHNRDGLSILVVLRHGGPRLLGRLLKRLRDKPFNDVPLDLHVVAPETDWEEIDRVVQEFDDATERATRLLPSVSLTLHAWDDGEVDFSKALVGMEGSVDVALVPNLFAAHTTRNAKTRRSTQAGGRFDPCLDPPTHIADSTGSGAKTAQNVARVLLPREPDPVLEAWSTVNLRFHRGEPVGDGDPEDVDYLALRVEFSRSASPFQVLHDVAHWVVTMDAFVGRDQIESLPSGPDVISVRSGLGKNQAYSLIISSRTGREFVVSRLIQRVKGLVPIGLENRSDEIAEALYDHIRQLSPDVLLRAMGLGRTTQEILGLIVARSAVDEQYPVSGKSSFTAWLSLDHHYRWFGSQSVSRADLVRLVGTWEGGVLRIQARVVESKFREQEETTKADVQVENSITLVRDALLVGSSARNDNEFWRREILDAIQQARSSSGEDSAAAAVRVIGEEGDPLSDLPDEVRADFLSGRFELDDVAGVVCTIVPTPLPDTGLESRTTKGWDWIRIGRRELARILGTLIDAPAHSVELPVDSSALFPDPQRRVPAVAAESVPAVVPTRVEASLESSRGLGTSGMEKKYQQVLDAFSEFGVPVRRVDKAPYNEGPGFYVVRVVPGQGTRADAVRRLHDELKLKLGLPAELTPRHYIDRGAVAFEVPKTDEERYFVSAEDLWSRTEWPPNALYAPLGEDINGEVVGVDFSSSDSPHLLIAGMTGSGKSVALETILHGLCNQHGPEALRLHLVDPKGTELAEFSQSEHVDGDIGMFPQDAKDLLDNAVVEMERRYALMREVRARSLPQFNERVSADVRLPWWLIVLDEYADLTADREDRKEIERNLQRLAQKARASGIHLIVATQKPSAEILSTSVRSNLSCQLALRVKTASDSRIVMDEAGAESLAGKGDALLKTVKATTRIQCAQLRTN